MTEDKARKRSIRTRMAKTGESYTAARRHVVKSKEGPPARLSVDLGKSDETIRRGSGKSWDEWFAILDAWGAEEHTHTEIARHLHEEHEVSGWWAQTVTVGYERIKGLRARGQRRDGTYEAGKSRTFNVPVAELYEAWKDAKVRKRWLDDASVKVRTATAPKSMRLGWSDGTIVAVGFWPKGPKKSSVAVQHTKLPDRETADRLKQYWSERFDALSEALA